MEREPLHPLQMDETHPPRGWVSFHHKVEDRQAERARQIDREAGRASREGTPAECDFIPSFNVGGQMNIFSLNWQTNRM
jgi:hypothetical protein